MCRGFSKFGILACLCLFISSANTAPDEWDIVRKHEGRFAKVPDRNGDMVVVDLDHLGPESYFDVDKDVHFYLYTKENPEEPQLIKQGDVEGVKKSNFKRERKTRFLPKLASEMTEFGMLMMF